MPDEFEEVNNFEETTTVEEPQLETEKSDIPDAFKNEETVVKTTSRTMSNIIKEKLAQIHDLATMEILLDASVRMRKRLESIKNMSSANNLKIQNHWKTIAPQMHIVGLGGRKVNNGEYQVTFSVYHDEPVKQVDGSMENVKKRFDHVTERQRTDGVVIKEVMSSEYRIAYEVTETIKQGKPMTRDVVVIDRIQGR